MGPQLEEPLHCPHLTFYPGVDSSSKEVPIVIFTEEVLVIVLAEVLLIVLPWLDVHACRRWVVFGGSQASLLQASLQESVAKCNYVK